MTADTLQRDIAAIARALVEARAQAEAGARIDLTGMEARIAALCAEAVERKAPDLGGSLRAELESLVWALDGLAAALLRQRDSITAASEGRDDPHTARQRAAALYGRSPATSPAAPPAAPAGPAPSKPALSDSDGEPS